MTRRFLILLSCIVALGACLRLYNLPSQILLDDEWLSLTAVIGKSWSDLLTKFNPVDNTSLPLNLYDLALLHGPGWSELLIRLPVILAGLASLVVLPLLVKKVLNERVAILFACLLAIAPFLIFYSRYARAYGLMMLFCFSALLLFHQWLATGKLRYAAGFVITGALAVAAHHFSIIAVFVPLITALAIVSFKPPAAPSSLRQQIAVPVRHLLIVAFLLAALVAPLCWPVLQASANLPWGKGNLTLEAIRTAATLLSGTFNGPLNAMFFLLCIAGLALLFKQHPLLGWTSLSTLLAYPAVLLSSRPLGLDHGAVLLRYMIIAIPICLTLVALALDDLITRAQQIPGVPRTANPEKSASLAKSSETSCQMTNNKFSMTNSQFRPSPPVGLLTCRALPVACAAAFLACLLAAGPLPSLYQSPNNFAGHSAFQYSYKNPGWESSAADTVYPAFQVKHSQIPPFYDWLGAQSNIAAVIEYPFDICDYNDLFYYYQHFHHKRVLAGYCRDAALIGYAFPPSPDPASGLVQAGRLCADDILFKLPDPAKLAFKNMIDITDPAALSRGGAGFLILHKYAVVLKIMSNGSGAAPVYGSIQVFYRSVDLLARRFKETLGPPAYEDAEIVCFQIQPVKS